MDIRQLKTILKIQGVSGGAKLQVENLSSSFKELLASSSLYDLVDKLVKEIGNAEIGNKELWQSDAHLKLKQFTRTQKVISSKLPDMLDLQWQEVLYFSNRNIQLVTIFTALAKTCTDKECITPDEYVRVFKSFSINLKKSMDIIPDFNIYTDLELFVGYNLQTPLSTIQKGEVAKDWCKGEVSRGDDEGWYYEWFEKCLLRRLYKHYDGKLIRVQPFKEFILNTNGWMTDGSSRGERVELFNVEKQRVVKSRSKKQAIGLIHSNLQIYNNCTNYDLHETYSVSEKIEPGRKKRCIISAPIYQQIRLSYVEFCIIKWIRTSLPEIFYLKSNLSQQAFQKDVSKLTTINTKQFKLPYVYFPLDASKFDQQVSGMEVKLVFACLAKAMLKFNIPGVNEVLPILTHSARSFFDTEVLIDKKLNIGRWEHGVPSGVRWTALLDSIINCVRFDICIEWHKQKLHHTLSPKFTQFQGDDMLLVLHHYSECVSILEFYASHNIEIHPLKNFASRHGLEFLRKVYVHNVLAYPNRLITKWLFRLPENRGSTDTRSLLQERVTSIVRLVRRYDTLDDLIILRSAELIRKATNFKGNIQELLLTSSKMGGFGVSLGKLTLSPRTNFNLSKFIWPKIPPDKHVKLGLTGNYKDLSQLYPGVKPELLVESIISSLDPAPPSNWDSTLRRVDVSFDFNRNLFTKIVLNKGVHPMFKPWLPVDSQNNPMLNDRLGVFASNKDVEAVRSITHESALPTFELYEKKLTEALFWNWITSGIDVPSIMNARLDGLSSSVCCRIVYSNLFIRFVTIHSKTSMLDAFELFVFSYLYILSNIDWLRRNVIMYSSTD